MVIHIAPVWSSPAASHHPAREGRHARVRHGTERGDAYRVTGHPQAHGHTPQAT
ncbi:hypothetical protein Thpro_022449 [Acidihalobacter prosperus]|uniref:Uncharacterized protein n=1 Tax=Acidihalobacter prosperus TaxID=160660 RepID=A0A1A6C0X1_9GAMM|nr:hypothetical protein Thpro_022449 [Acidihalobacter prosperus]